MTLPIEIGEEVQEMLLMDSKIRDYIQCDKKVIDDSISFKAPQPGTKIDIALFADQFPSDKFALTISEGKRSSTVILSISVGRKVSMGTRRSSQTLVRIDLDEKATHRNPDGTLVHGSHVHIARDGFGDRFAYPIASQEGIMVAGETDEVLDIFESFRKFCHIDDSLIIEWTLGI